MTAGEDLLLGLQTLVLGMIVTFVGLLILQGVMILMARFSKVNANNSRPSNATKDDSDVTMEGFAVQPESPSQPDEEIAAISAVMAVLAAESGAPMQARSVRRISPASTAAPNIWGLAGRQEIMAARRRAQQATK